MAEVQIPDLPAVTTPLAESDLAHIRQGVDGKATLAELRAGILKEVFLPSYAGTPQTINLDNNDHRWAFYLGDGTSAGTFTVNVPDTIWTEDSTIILIVNTHGGVINGNVNVVAQNGTQIRSVEGLTTGNGSITLVPGQSLLLQRNAGDFWTGNISGTGGSAIFEDITVENSITFVNPSTPANTSLIEIENIPSSQQLMLYGKNTTSNGGWIRLRGEDEGFKEVEMGVTSNKSFSVLGEEDQRVRRGGALEKILSEAELNNTLTSTSTTDALTAAQGKILQDSKLNSSQVNNTLISTSTTDALSAAQGKDLQDNKLNKSQVNNTLTSTSTTQALSAAQGKNLQDNKLNKSQVVDTLASTSTTDALSASRGKFLQDQIDSIPGAHVPGSGYAVVVQADRISYFSANTNRLELDETDILEATEYTVGPTGSGADIIWADMDNLPVDAYQIDLKASIIIGTASASYFIQTWAYANDLNTYHPSSLLFSMKGSSNSDDNATVNTVKVPINTGINNGTFRIRWNETRGATLTFDIDLFLVGYTAN
jgi:hypothetical protein